MSAFTVDLSIYAVPGVTVTLQHTECKRKLVDDKRRIESHISRQSSGGVFGRCHPCIEIHKRVGAHPHHSRSADDLRRIAGNTFAQTLIKIEMEGCHTFEKQMSTRRWYKPLSGCFPEEHFRRKNGKKTKKDYKMVV